MAKIITLLIVLIFSPLTYAYTNPPFVNAIKVGNILYLSGQIGSVKPGQPPLKEKGIVPETRQAMKNIQQVLEENGSSLSQIFKCNVMMADMKEWDAMNKVYAEFFPDGKFPVRSAFGTTGLVLDARVEIECTATVKNQEGNRS